jgi:hypothetical protein
MKKKSQAEYLDALDAFEAESEQIDGNHDDFENPVLLSEAEQMAALASPPQRRVDGLYAASGMKIIRPLTAQQQAYARGLVEGKTMRQAYRDAYPNDSSNNAAISASAWKLKQNPAIMALVAAAWEDI